MQDLRDPDVNEAGGLRLEVGDSLLYRVYIVLPVLVK